MTELTEFSTRALTLVIELWLRYDNFDLNNAEMPPFNATLFLS
jgi:hypothetical protein